MVCSFAVDASIRLAAFSRFLSAAVMLWLSAAAAELEATDRAKENAEVDLTLTPEELDKWVSADAYHAWPRPGPGLSNQHSLVFLLLAALIDTRRL